MSTKKAIGISFVAIFILIIAQIIAQVIASVFVIIKIPYGICNIIAGTMVGVMFSMIAIESGSVWNSGIVHAIWNIVIIGGGLAIGEKMDPYSVMTYVLDSKVFAITGGEFGIESSVISLIGYIIVAGIAFIMIKSNRKN
jgi:hypothetical protein